MLKLFIISLFVIICTALLNLNYTQTFQTIQSSPNQLHLVLLFSDSPLRKTNSAIDTLKSIEQSLIQFAKFYTLDCQDVKLIDRFHE